jgi:ppGpp synthetase/RelA/SpoT-type nucleotidyltranferase
MRKRQKEAILISFFKEKEKYERLAEYMVHLLRDDPSSPRESLHTIIYRIKDESRLIEKIDIENKKPGTKGTLITHRNFQERIGDILGIRMICLRLSDIKRVEAYLEQLADEKILRFMQSPDHKRSFVLPLDPGDTAPAQSDLRYSGYSSVHYQIELGQNSDAADELRGLQMELQLRTILEEAWGEIDHKYRYAYCRRGDSLPEYIHSGFYNLSAYLQVAALQAEHLCRQIEAHRLSLDAAARERAAASTGPEAAPAIPPAVAAGLEEVFGFKLSVRTIAYILKRLGEFRFEAQPLAKFQKLLTKARLRTFRTVYREIFDREAFDDLGKRNVDAINAFNFALFDETQGELIAQEGLRSVLKWRKEHSKWEGAARRS